MWTPANTGLAWWTAALWLHSPHSALELGEGFADHRGRQAYQSGLNEQRPQYQHGTEKNVLSPIKLLVDSVELELCLFHLLICLKYTFFFFLIHAQKLQIWLVQIDQRASAEVLCQYLKLQDLWCYAVSSIFVVPSCPRHGAQSFVVAWLLPLSLELGIVQVLRMRKGNWDTSLWVNKQVWGAPMSLRLSGENCLSGKLCSISMSSMCFLVGSNKCLTTIPVSCR